MIQFVPALPTSKIESIKRVGYGLLNKVILFFNKSFWDVNNDYIGKFNYFSYIYNFIIIIINIKYK